MNYAEEAVQIIDWLNSKGKRADSLSEAFPRIHHFNKSGGDATLESFYKYCKERERDLEGITNINVVKRLQIIKEKTESFLIDNPDKKISSIKFQAYAYEAIKIIPL